jgi:Domain of unknown function (DUF1707)
MSPMPGDDGGEVQLRASDADRERVAGLLGEALADGRLTVDEHRERIGEQECFGRFLATGRRDHAAEAAQRRTWLGLMRRITAAGVQVRRARIVSEPVSNYIRFEWHGADPAIEAGEDLRWLPRRLASGIALPGNDFWLLDRRTAMFKYFSGDGRPLGQEITDDAAAVELCRAAFDAVWKLAIPHGEYEI